MAVAEILVLAGLSTHQHRDRVDAVHRALVGALRVPHDDPTVLLQEVEPKAVVLPAHATRAFSFVKVTMFSGRSLETKRTLYRLICQELEKVGVAGSDVLIVVVESPTDNWGIQGGQVASEVDLGFDLDP